MEAFRPTQNDSTRLIHEACVFFLGCKLLRKRP